MNLQFLADPRLAFEEAHTSGHWAIEFMDHKEALRFARQLYRLKGTEVKRGLDWCRALYIHKLNGRVEVIDTDHPDAAKYIPTLKGDPNEHP